MKKTDIIVAGGPASGKGTQAEAILEEVRSLASDEPRIISTRKELEDMGIDMRPYHHSGGFVPDDVMIPCWDLACLREEETTIRIHDGFCRTVEQVRALREKFKHNNSFKLFIILRAKEETLLQRMLNRGRPEECCEARMETHRLHFDKAIREIYELFGEDPYSQIENINAEKDPKEITREIWAIVANIALADAFSQERVAITA